MSTEGASRLLDAVHRLGYALAPSADDLAAVRVCLERGEQPDSRGVIKPRAGDQINATDAADGFTPLELARKLRFLLCPRRSKRRDLIDEAIQLLEGTASSAAMVDDDSGEADAKTTPPRLPDVSAPATAGLHDVPAPAAPAAPRAPSPEPVLAEPTKALQFATPSAGATPPRRRSSGAPAAPAASAAPPQPPLQPPLQLPQQLQQLPRPRRTSNPTRAPSVSDVHAGGQVVVSLLDDDDDDDKVGGLEDGNGDADIEMLPSAAAPPPAPRASATVGAAAVAGAAAVPQLATPSPALAVDRFAAQDAVCRAVAALSQRESASEGISPERLLQAVPHIAPSVVQGIIRELSAEACVLFVADNGKIFAV